MSYGAIIGAGLTMANSQLNNNQSNANANKNLNRQKNLSNHLHNLSMKYWNETNYGAQMEHLKNAGLNPALMYAQGGSGGSTATFNSSVDQGQSHYNMQGIQTGLQIEAQKAQIDNIKADTAAKEADANKKGVEIKSLTQGIENQKTINELNKVQTKLLEVGLKKENETYQSYLDRFEAETNKAIGEAEIALSQAHVDTNTRNEKIEILKNEAINSSLQGKLTNAQIVKLNAEVNKIAHEILKIDHDKKIDWAKIDNDKQRVIIEAVNTKIKEEYPSVQNVIGGQMMKFSEFISKLNLNKSVYPSRRINE